MEFSLIYRSKIISSAYSGWISSDDSILDIGCGNTVVTDELRKHFNCDIVGTDIIDYRRRKIKFKIISGQKRLSFNNKEFDISMFNDTLHHCEDWQALLSEAFRVADRVLIFEMEPTVTAKIGDVLINLIHNPHMNIPLNIKSAHDWRSCFERLGYDFEYRKIKKPFLFYPFLNFAFKLMDRP